MPGSRSPLVTGSGRLLEPRTFLLFGYDRPRIARDCLIFGTSLCQLDLQIVAVGSVSPGPGSDLSDDPALGVEPGALDREVAPTCPPGLVTLRSASLTSWR